MHLRRIATCLLVTLLLLQAAQILFMLRQETLTLDEADHTYSGYRMWHNADYGINPEHPPLVKLVATLPLLGRKLWLPDIQQQHFKNEAYVGGRDFLQHNDGPSQRLFLQVRLAVMVFALGMLVAVYLLAWQLFGVEAAMLAALLTAFEPNLIAHSGRVTTDMGLVCLLLLCLLAFYRFAASPGWLRLLLSGLATGLVLAAKHSGVLVFPILLLLALTEILAARPGYRVARAKLLIGGLAVTFALSLAVLWSFYGFRFAMRPPGIAMVPTLQEYLLGIPPGLQWIVSHIAQARLLPESYLMGLVDIKTQEQSNPAFLLGTNYAHGIWWYFPVALTIKSTLGLIALVLLAALAILTRRFKQTRELAYIVIPGLVYLAAAMMGHMDIGIRHVLFLYPLAIIFASAGAWALIQQNCRWTWVAAALACFHILSSLLSLPTQIAYANEAWGGPSNVHRYLSDSSVDWGQQLYSVRRWVDAHPGQECWFAYVGRPYLSPEEYGIHCHPLPNIATSWLGLQTDVPPAIHGNLLVSADNLEGCEWPDVHLNPYNRLRSLPIASQIDHGVMVFTGDISIPEVAGLSAAQRSQSLLSKNQAAEALAAARRSVALDPLGIPGQSALADAAVAAGDNSLAASAYRSAIALSRQMQPGAREQFLPLLEQKLTQLSPDRLK